MTWVLYFICFLTLLAVWDVETKVKKLLRAQNIEGEDPTTAKAGGTFDFGSLKGKKVKIFLDDECEIEDCVDFTAGLEVEGEIVDFDDTWLAFRYRAKKYEKVPEKAGNETVYVARPVKGALVTQYIRIADIESIDEVINED